MAEQIGRKVWIIPDGYLPERSSGYFVSHGSRASDWLCRDMRGSKDEPCAPRHDSQFEGGEDTGRCPVCS